MANILKFSYSAQNKVLCKLSSVPFKLKDFCKLPQSSAN